MSNMTEFLESLDNKELRAKCLEYNLPNVPITDNTRKLLIRRLIPLMTGQKKEEKKNQPKRRETTHVAHVTIEDCEDDESDSYTPAERLNSTYPNILTRQTTKKLGLNDSDFSDIDSVSLKPKRKSTDGRKENKSATESKVDKNLNTKKSFVRPSISPNLSIDSSFDESNRSSRSVSLSRSGITTTSYSVEVEKPDFDYEDEDEAMDLDEAEDEEEDQYEPEPRFKTMEPQIYERDYHLKNTVPNEFTIQKSYVSPISCLKKNNLSQMSIPPGGANPKVSFSDEQDSSFTYQSNSREAAPYTKSFLEKERYHKITMESTKAKEVEPEPSLYPFKMLNNAATSMAQTIETSPYRNPSPNPFITRPSGRTSLASPGKPYQRSSVQKRSSYKSSYGYNDGETDTVSSHSESEYDDSYIESKQKLISKDFSSQVKHSSSPKARSSLARRSLRPENTSAMSRFTNYLVALDQKYKISYLVLFSAAFILIVILLVFFFL